MFYSVSPQGAQIIALQECGPRTARLMQKELGQPWKFAQSDSEDPVATFWDGDVFRFAQHETLNVFPRAMGSSSAGPSALAAAHGRTAAHGQ